MLSRDLKYRVAFKWWQTIEFVYGEVEYSLDPVTMIISSQRPYDKSVYAVEKYLMSVPAEETMTAGLSPLYEAMLTKKFKLKMSR